MITALITTLAAILTMLIVATARTAVVTGPRISYPKIQRRTTADKISSRALWDTPLP
jgi:hypothetical protein